MKTLKTLGSIFGAIGIGLLNLLLLALLFAIFTGVVYGLVLLGGAIGFTKAGFFVGLLIFIAVLILFAFVFWVVTVSRSIRKLGFKKALRRHNIFSPDYPRGY